MMVYKQLPEKPESRDGSLANSPEPLPTDGEDKEVQEVIAVTSDQDSDIISLSKFSTMCLGADITIKENDGLEQPCALQLFPNNNIEMKNAMRVSNRTSPVWHPSNSVTPKERIKKEFTFLTASPSLKTPDIPVKSKASQPMVRSQSETRLDHFPVIYPESKSGMLVTDINLTNQAKLDRTETHRASSSDQKMFINSKRSTMKTLRHKYAGYIRSRKIQSSQTEINRASLPKPMLPHTDKKACSVKPYPSEFTIPDNMKVMQYTLWSTDGNKSSVNTSEFGQSTKNSKTYELDRESLQKVAAFILSEHPSPPPVRHEIAVADGVLPLKFLHLSWHGVHPRNQHFTTQITCIVS